MFKKAKGSFIKPLILALFFLLFLPTITMAEEPEHMLSYLISDGIILAFISSNTLLLLGVLLRLNQTRKEILRKTDTIDKSKKYVHLIGESLPKAMIFQLAYNVSNKKFSVQYLSKGCSNLFGLTRASVMQNTALIFDLIHDEDKELVYDLFEQSKRNPMPADLELRIKDGNGGLTWLRVNVMPDLKKGLLTWNGIIQTITQQKNKEANLIEEKQNFQNLFETMDDFLLVADPDGTLLYCNLAMEDRLGFSQPEFCAKNLCDLFAPNLHEQVKSLIPSIRHNRPVSCRYPLQSKSGKEIPTKMSLFHGSWNNQPAIYGVARDLVDQQASEKKFRDSQKMLQIIINAIPAALFWKNKDSVYIGCNKLFAKQCGYNSIRDIVGKTPFDLFDKEKAQWTVDEDCMIMASNKSIVDELQAFEVNGEKRWQETNKMPLHDSQGNIVGTMGSLRDITERYLAKEQLQQTLEDMDRFNQLMRGREGRTLELKAEINQLLEEQGKPARYKTTDLT